MAFRLKQHEKADKGIKRVVGRQIDKALKRLSDVQDEHETVHDVRTCCKRIRAALRLVRREMGEDYGKKNRAFRDMARPLTELRDAEVRLEALGKMGKNAFPHIRKHFQDQHDAVRSRVLEQKRSLANLSRQMTTQREALKNWPLKKHGWKKLRQGAAHVYKQGRDAYRLAEKQPSNEHLHEWRKQSKYLWHELTLMGGDKKRRKQSRKLAQLLGDDHDLAMLRRAVIGIGGKHGELIKRIDRQRRDLQKKALQLGKDCFGKRPKAFLAQLH